MSFQAIKTDKEASLHKFLLSFTLSEMSFPQPTHRIAGIFLTRAYHSLINTSPPKPNILLMKFLSVRVLYANVPRPLPHMQSGWRRQTMDCPRNAFYLTPLQNWNSTAGSVWFFKTNLLVIKKLSTIMSSFCQDARIQGFRNKPFFKGYKCHPFVSTRC